MRHAFVVAAILLAATLSDGAAQSTIPIHARGFADFNYIGSQRPIAKGFRTGQIVAHVAAGLSDRVALFSEISATTASSGFTLEVERLLLRYDRSDRIKLGIGRFHVPLAYWNIAFHHGQWLQPSLSRPDMVRGGTPFVPMHFVGLWAEGELATGPLGIGYTMGWGNGRGTNLAKAGDAGDVNGSRAFVLSTALSVPALTGVRIGGAYYRDRATPRETVDADERILSGYLAVERDAPELIVEYARITHDPRNALLPASTSEGGYVLFGYRLPGTLRDVKPYVRYDRTRVPASDSVFSGLRLNYSGRIAGARYDLSSGVALKLEYRSEKIEGAAPLGTFAAQVSFTFPGGGGVHTLADHEDEVRHRSHDDRRR